MRFLGILLLCTTAWGWQHAEWLKSVEGRTDPSVALWLRQQINPDGRKEEVTLLENTPCKNCFKGKIAVDEEPELLVFMSFSVPDTLWEQISKEMGTHKAAIVLRGLPNNSFHVLADKLAQLKAAGVQAPVMIDPRLFRTYNVERVPSYVFLRDRVHKCTGAVSIAYAQALLRE